MSNQKGDMNLDKIREEDSGRWFHFLISSITPQGKYVSSLLRRCLVSPFWGRIWMRTELFNLRLGVRVAFFSKEGGNSKREKDGKMGLADEMKKALLTCKVIPFYFPPPLLIGLSKSQNTWEKWNFKIIVWHSVWNNSGTGKILVVIEADP